MKKILLVAICLISFTVIEANQPESYKIEKIISVYDGDTFRADIRGLPDIIGKNIAIRILEIDTPEIKGKCEEEKIVAIKASDVLDPRKVNPGRPEKLKKIEKLRRG